MVNWDINDTMIHLWNDLVRRRDHIESNVHRNRLRGQDTFWSLRVWRSVRLGVSKLVAGRSHSSVLHHDRTGSGKKTRVFVLFPQVFWWRFSKLFEITIVFCEFWFERSSWCRRRRRVDIWRIRSRKIRGTLYLRSCYRSRLLAVSSWRVRVCHYNQNSITAYGKIIKTHRLLYWYRIAVGEETIAIITQDAIVDTGTGLIFGPAKPMEQINKLIGATDFGEGTYNVSIRSVYLLRAE